MQKGNEYREFSEEDQLRIIKIFLNDGYGALSKDKGLIAKYGESFIKHKDVKNLLKSARFNKYFEKRLKNAINAISNLENMSNTNNYYFSRHEVVNNLRELRNAHAKMQQSFMSAFEKIERQEREEFEGENSKELNAEELLRNYRATKDKNTERGIKS